MFVIFSLQVHFKPSEIEFVAGRKRVKLGSVPSRFCTCLEDQENCSRSNEKGRHVNSAPKELIIMKNVPAYLCDHIYSTSDQRKSLRALLTCLVGKHV